MYDVNTKRIDKILAHMEKMIALLHQLTAEEAETKQERNVQDAAMERALHLSIEAIVDVGNALIDGFIMRDPGSYTDIVEILRDERVLTDEQAAVLTEVVAFRKQLVNEYTNVPTDEMRTLVKQSLFVLEQFAPAVKSYVKQELF